MKIAFHPLPTAEVEKIRQTGRDAYGLPVERHISTGGVFPCRHCLGEIPAGGASLCVAVLPRKRSLMEASFPWLARSSNARRST